MKAFISYSHKDGHYLDLLVKHLALLIDEWTDNAIEAGGNIHSEIDTNLSGADLFIALLSPDYMNSNYCYEIEFEKAQQLKEQGKLKIIPIVVEDCDWGSSPFAKMKALPKDGKAIATWSNENTAMLDVIQNIRKMVGNNVNSEQTDILSTKNVKVTRDYKVQKDFDSIQKTEFLEEGFRMLREKLNDNLLEIQYIDGIVAKKLKDTDKEFECILVNRNKIQSEATLSLTSSLDKDKNNRKLYRYTFTDYFVGYDIVGGDDAISTQSFSLEFDDYEMYWKSQDYALGLGVRMNQDEKLRINDIVERCWNDWLHAIGINY